MTAQIFAEGRAGALQHTGRGVRAGGDQETHQLAECHPAVAGIRCRALPVASDPRRRRQPIVGQFQPQGRGGGPASTLWHDRRCRARHGVSHDPARAGASLLGQLWRPGQFHLRRAERENRRRSWRIIAGYRRCRSARGQGAATAWQTVGTGRKSLAGSGEQVRGPGSGRRVPSNCSTASI